MSNINLIILGLFLTFGIVSSCTVIPSNYSGTLYINSSQCYIIGNATVQLATVSTVTNLTFGQIGTCDNGKQWNAPLQNCPAPIQYSITRSINPSSDLIMSNGTCSVDIHANSCPVNPTCPSYHITASIPVGTTQSFFNSSFCQAQITSANCPAPPKCNITQTLVGGQVLNQNDQYCNVHITAPPICPTINQSYSIHATIQPGTTETYTNSTHCSATIISPALPNYTITETQAPNTTINYTSGLCTAHITTSVCPASPRCVLTQAFTSGQSFNLDNAQCLLTLSCPTCSGLNCPTCPTCPSHIICPVCSVIDKDSCGQFYNSTITNTTDIIDLPISIAGLSSDEKIQLLTNRSIDSIANSRVSSCTSQLSSQTAQYTDLNTKYENQVTLAKQSQTANDNTIFWGFVVGGGIMLLVMVLFWFGGRKFGEQKAVMGDK